MFYRILHQKSAHKLLQIFTVMHIVNYLYCQPRDYYYNKFALTMARNLDDDLCHFKEEFVLHTNYIYNALKKDIKSQFCNNLRRGLCVLYGLLRIDRNAYKSLICNRLILTKVFSVYYDFLLYGSKCIYLDALESNLLSFTVWSKRRLYKSICLITSTLAENDRYEDLDMLLYPHVFLFLNHEINNLVILNMNAILCALLDVNLNIEKLFTHKFREMLSAFKELIFLIFYDPPDGDNFFNLYNFMNILRSLGIKKSKLNLDNIATVFSKETYKKIINTDDYCCLLTTLEGYCTDQFILFIVEILKEVIKINIQPWFACQIHLSLVLLLNINSEEVKFLIMEFIINQIEHDQTNRNSNLSVDCMNYDGFAIGVLNDYTEYISYMTDTFDSRVLNILINIEDIMFFKSVGIILRNLFLRRPEIVVDRIITLSNQEISLNLLVAIITHFKNEPKNILRIVNLTKNSDGFLNLLKLNICEYFVRVQFDEQNSNEKLYDFITIVEIIIQKFKTFHDIPEIAQFFKEFTIPYILEQLLSLEISKNDEIINKSIVLISLLREL